VSQFRQRATSPSPTLVRARVSGARATWPPPSAAGCSPDANRAPSPVSRSN